MESKISRSNTEMVKSITDGYDYDHQGPARREPRRHILPLVKLVARIFERLLKKASDQVPLFSTDE
jgi:hypothetical protein